MDALWPDATPQAGAGNLRMLVHRLRRAVGNVEPSPVVVVHQWITLNPNYSWEIDLEAFEQVLATVGDDCASLECAAQLYAEEALPDNRYDDWAIPIREHVCRLQREMCLHLAELYLERGQYEQCATWCEHLLERDPLDEAAFQALFQAWSALGRRADALRRYRAFERQLAEGFGVAPDLATVALLDHTRPIIQQEQVEGEALVAARRTLSILPSYPLPVTEKLVGRTSELEAVLSALPSGRRDAAQLLLIAGEAGMGKTRLLAEVAQRGRKRGLLTLAGGSYEGEGRLPYAPIHDALLDFVLIQPLALLRRQLGGLLPDLVTVVPELRARLPDVANAPGGDEEGLRLRLFSTVAQVLATIAMDQPLVLLLDDLQWADDGTLDLLHFLSRQPTMDRVLIVGACREEEIHLESLLERMILQGAETRWARTLLLAPLEQAPLTSLLEERLGAPCTEPLAQGIFRRSGGNPFFALQILQLLQQEERLEETKDGWGFLPGTTITVPNVIQTVATRRLRLLPEETRKVISLGAVLGREFHYSALEAIWEGDDHSLFEALDVARQAHIVDETERGYTFRHPLLHEAVCNRIPDHFRKRLHRQAGVALEQLYGEKVELHAAELLTHFREAEEDERALRYALAAARHAEAVYAHSEVDGYARTALRLSRDLEDRNREAAALEHLGTALRHLSRYTEALTALHQARALYADIEDREGEDRVTARAGWVYLATGAAQEGVVTVQGALQRRSSHEPSPALFSLYEVLATLLERVDRSMEALEAAEYARDLARAMDDQLMLVRAEGRRGYILNSSDRPEEALRVLEPVVSLAQSHGDLDTLRRALNNVAHIYSGLGEPDKARAYYERALTAARRSGNLAAVGQATNVLGREAVHRADWRHAQQYCEAAIAMAESTGDIETLLDGHWWLAESELLTGQPEAVLARLEPWLDDATLRGDLRFDVLVPLARAHIELSDGAHATSLITEAVEWVRREGDRVDLRDSLIVQGMVASRQGDSEEAVESFEEALRLSRSMPRHRQGKFRTLGEARALQEYGFACIRSGEHPKARRLLDEALAIFQYLGTFAYVSQTEEAMTRIG